MQTQSAVSSLQGTTTRCGLKDPGLQPQPHNHVRITIDLSLDRNGSPVFAVSADRKMPMDILKAAFRGGLAALESDKTRHVRK
jgi:hypothetical protein